MNSNLDKVFISKLLLLKVNIINAQGKLLKQQLRYLNLVRLKTSLWRKLNLHHFCNSKFLFLLPLHILTSAQVLMMNHSF